MTHRSLDCHSFSFVMFHLLMSHLLFILLQFGADSEEPLEKWNFFYHSQLRGRVSAEVKQEKDNAAKLTQTVLLYVDLH